MSREEFESIYYPLKRQGLSDTDIAEEHLFISVATLWRLKKKFEIRVGQVVNKIRGGKINAN